MHITTPSKKEAMNLKENKEGYIGVRKGKEEMNVIKISEKQKKKNNLYLTIKVSFVAFNCTADLVPQGQK